ncbi:MAG: hypothetical protein ACYDD4_03900 [Acidimicrobiales bacterium]
MHLVRRFTARLSVSLGLFAAGTSLSMWWTSLVASQAQSAISAANGLPKELAGVVGQAIGSKTATGAGAATHAAEQAIGQVNFNAGPQVAHIAHDLRLVALGALAVALILVATGAALTLSGSRHKVTHRVGRWATLTGGAAVVLTWVAPAIASAEGHGTVHTVAHTVLVAGTPGRMVSSFLCATGVVVLIAASAARRRHGLAAVAAPVEVPAGVPAVA